MGAAQPQCTLKKIHKQKKRGQWDLSQFLSVPVHQLFQQSKIKSMWNSLSVVSANLSMFVRQSYVSTVLRLSDVLYVLRSRLK